VYQQRNACALAVSIAAPPYDSFGATVDLRAICPGNLVLGTIFGLEISGALTDADVLVRETQSIRHQWPGVPLVLRISGGLDTNALHLAQVAAQLHVHAVVIDGEPIADVMRRILTTPLDLAADVVAWLAMRLPLLPPQVADLCRVIFRYATAESTVGALLSSVGESARSARARFRKLALPSPSSWHQVARAIHAALTIQRVPHAPLFDLAMQLGYSDHSALSHQFVRLFGLRASQVRQLLGWEWLFESWLTRHSAVASALA
jgi:AraC-like DNA-binding protein